ncbi:MAG TPA: hypothetical protein VIE65_14765 [Methylobacter sp.]
MSDHGIFRQLVADSIRYEEETIRTLHDSNCEIPALAGVHDASGETNA